MLGFPMLYFLMLIRSSHETQFSASIPTSIHQKKAGVGGKNHVLMPSKSQTLNKALFFPLLRLSLSLNVHRLYQWFADET